MIRILIIKCTSKCWRIASTLHLGNRSSVPIHIYSKTRWATPHYTFEYSSVCSLVLVLIRQIVLDVRCGLGLLSMFAAIAGAKHVYAIDKSNIVQLTQRVVRDNRFADKITIIQGSVADINLPVDRVDIIISTFLGYISCIQKNPMYIYNWPLRKYVALLRFDTQRINLLWQLARRDHYGPW